MRQTRTRALSWLLALALVLGLLPGITPAASAAAPSVTVTYSGGSATVSLTRDGSSESVTFSSCQTLSSSSGTVTLDNDTCYTLDTDITVKSIDIPSSCTKVAIDLKGHVLLGDGSGSVMNVSQGAMLYLLDSAPSNTTRASGFNRYGEIPGGLVTGGEATLGGGIHLGGKCVIGGGTLAGNTASGGGGGVYITGSSSCSLVMYAGTISNNTASSLGGGGVFTGQNSEFTMYAGTISDNSGKDGGGVYITGTSSRFIMEGGDITGNTARNLSVYGSGGGVCADDNSSIAIRGGSISGNTAKDGGGVYLAYSSACSLSGAPRITGNTANNSTLVGGPPHNLYCYSRKTVSASGLTSGAAIGVSTSVGVTAGTAGHVTVTSGYDSTVTSYFTSDQGYVIALENGEITLCPQPVAKVGETGYETLNDAFTRAASGSTITLIQDTVEAVTLSLPKTLTLDFADKSLEASRGAAYTLTVSNANATLNITGSASGKIGSGTSGALMAGSGTIVIQDGVIRGGLANESGKYVINGGSFPGGALSRLSGAGAAELYGGYFWEDYTGSAYLQTGYIVETYASGKSYELPWKYTDHAYRVTWEYAALTAGPTIRSSAGKMLTTSSSSDAPRVGQTLTATTAAKPVDWEWKVGGTAVTNVVKSGSTSSYVVQEGDVGKTVTVTAIQRTDVSGKTRTTPAQYSTSTKAVERLDGPAKPGRPEATVSGTTITVTSPTGAGSTVYEYSADGGASWQTSPTFSGLDVGTAYQIAARVRETGSTKAGAASDTLTVGTAPVLTVVNETIQGKEDGRISGVSNAMEYKKGDGAFISIIGSELTGRGPDEYTIHVKGCGNDEATVTVTIEEGPAATVSFQSNGGGAVSAVSGLRYGDHVSAPAEPTRAGYYFSGWYKDEDCKQPWSFEEDTVRELSTTLYAKWSVLTDYSGIVTDYSGTAPLSGVTVTFRQGSTLFGTAVTDGNGAFRLTAPAGSYNVVLSDGTVTKTELVELTEDAALSLRMPDGGQSSILDIADAGKYAPLVGGLDQLAEGFSGQAVTVRLTVRAEDSIPAADQAAFQTGKSKIAALAGGQALEYLDLKLEKTTPGGDVEDIGGDNTQLLTIVIPYHRGDKQNLRVYRYHAGDDAAAVLTETPNGDGEQIAIGEESITLLVRRFSAYAIGYALDEALDPAVELIFNEINCPVRQFTDTNPRAWYHNGVHYCLENNIMQGYGDGLFGPTDPATRAHIVTILWNMEGNPVSDCELTFEDIGTRWFASAVRWATEESLVTGYTAETFGPDDNITREQLIALLYRYAQHLGVDVSVTKQPNMDYDDIDELGIWATPSMEWAVSVGLIVGRRVDGSPKPTLDPKDSATRAEIATIMMRFCQKLGY